MVESWWVSKVVQSDSIEYRWPNPGGSAKLCRIDEQTRLSLTHFGLEFITHWHCAMNTRIYRLPTPRTPLSEPHLSASSNKPKRLLLYISRISAGQLIGHW